MSLHPLHLASALASVAALAVACVALLRPPAPAVDPAALAAVREELAELRHSVEVTRNQAVGPSGNHVVAANYRYTIGFALKDGNSSTVLDGFRVTYTIP